MQSQDDDYSHAEKYPDLQRAYRHILLEDRQVVSIWATSAGCYVRFPHRSRFNLEQLLYRSVQSLGQLQGQVGGGDVFAIFYGVDRFTGDGNHLGQIFLRQIFHRPVDFQRVGK